MMLRYLTAGESHGRALVAILEGVPAGLPLAAADIDAELARRQRGYGRGARMEIERDRVEITAGVRGGETLGSPLALRIENRDWESWQEVMAETAPLAGTPVTCPRPGHADLAGAIKYSRADLRDILERASARETAARVAVGAVARRLLREFGISLGSHVLAIAGIWAGDTPASARETAEAAEASPVRCADPVASLEMMRAIDRAKQEGDSLGGVWEVIATGLPVGLGSHVHWDRRLDGRLAAAVMSIPGIKGVEIGLGFEAAGLPGTAVHDSIRVGREDGCLIRLTNHAGGVEGGITNGEPIVVRAAMKPIPTLTQPLDSVDITDFTARPAAAERSDVCAVPAAAVVGEAVVAFELARAAQEKYGGDSLREMLAAYRRGRADSRERFRLR
jgi:chorismate synthase